MLVKPSRHKSGKDNYCSNKCYQDSRSEKVKLTCNYCNKYFEEYPSKISDNRGKFCSKDCYFEDKRKNQIVCVCSLCGEEFKLCKSEYDVRKNNKSDMIFCSNKCYHEHNTGENVYNWNPETNELYRIRHSRNYLDWRNLIYERDNYTCQACGKKGCRLNAHHINGFANNINLRLNIDNGITLCKGCHQEYHTIYGVNNANETDFYNWLELKEVIK